MSDYLPFLVVGLTAGSIYALAAMGLTVTYTTSGVFNFCSSGCSKTAWSAAGSSRPGVAKSPGTRPGS